MMALILFFSGNPIFSFHSITKRSSSFQAVVDRLYQERMGVQDQRLKKHSPKGQDERHLQRTENNDQCKPTCSMDNKVCNCNALKECVNDMSGYDASLSVFGGYVNTEPGNQEYGNFTVQNLKLFDVGGQLPAKFSRIKSLAKESGDDCTALLSEFTTVCDPEASSCSSTNEYTHQLSIQQVCNSVGNPKKLLISVMLVNLVCNVCVCPSKSHALICTCCSVRTNLMVPRHYLIHS